MITSFDVIGSIPSALTVALLGRLRLHVLKLPITKSESVAVGLCEDRVSARKLEKQPPRPNELRFTPSSRNSPAAGAVSRLLLINAQGVLIAEPLTIAKVLLGGVATGT